MMNSLLFLHHLKESKIMSCTKAVLRTIFYQYFLLFVGLAVGFIGNAEWVGFKSCLVERSIKNIFFPIKFTPKMESGMKFMLAERMRIKEGYPAEFEVLSSVIVANDEFCWIAYKYRDQDGKLVFKDDVERMRWKTWEYNYDEEAFLNPINTEEEWLALDKRMSDWQQKIKDAIDLAKERKAEILKEEQQRKIKEAI
jgi:hypothetical protein